MFDETYECYKCKCVSTPEARVQFTDEIECMECYKNRSDIERAAKLELAARWYERNNLPVPDYIKPD